MKPPVLPSREEVTALARQQYDDRGVAKACANCIHWVREQQFCPINNKMSPAFMTCAKHESELTHIVNTAMKVLEIEATESKKIEYLLSTALSLADMTMTVLGDLETRIKKQRDREKDSRGKSALKKDLNLCEELDSAYEKIAEHIGKIEQQYNFYVQPQFNRAFKRDDGKYDVENHDKFKSDVGEFVKVLLKYCRGCFLNEGNVTKVFDCLDSLKNDQYFPLTEKDIEHYTVKI